MGTRWIRHDLGSSRCLDGSAAAFYYRPPHGGSNSTQSFVIFLEGGGWCASAADCVSRTQTSLGSSKSWPSTSRSPGNGGQYFEDGKLGGEFSRSGIIHMKYCDATSFSGSHVKTIRAKHGALQVGQQRIEQGDTLFVHFSGRAILDAALDILLHSPSIQMAHATDVLVSGCSAGGLAALLAAEAVHARLKAQGAPLTRFKVALFSGIFHSPEASPYTRQMKELHRVARMVVPESCARRFGPEESWRCVVGMQPLESLPRHIPVFIEQSALDRWQTGCVLGAAPSRFEIVRCSAGAWDRCLGFMRPLQSPRARAPKVGHRRLIGRAASQQQQCTSEQLRSLDDFSTEFMHLLTSSPALHRPGSGAFIHGCHSHCPSKLSRFVVDGTTLEHAMVQWWRASADAPAAQHTFVGCLESLSNATPARCRPACSPLYPWPDERRKIAIRSRAVDMALNGEISEELRDPIP